MSIEYITLVWKHSSSTLGARLVMLALADYADENGVAWPSIDTLAKKSKLSERNTRLCLRSLEECGEIKTEKNAGRNGVNRYRITIDPGANSSGGQNLPGAKSDIEGGQDQACKGGKDCPQSVIEPSIDPSIPSTPDGAKPKKPEAKPDVEKETHREFIELWTESFEIQFGRKYVFQGGKDGQALKRLIAASKMTAGDLMGIATKAWQKKGRDFWNCQRAVTICDFASRFNQILDELNRRSGIEILKPPGVQDDHEARYGFRRGGKPLSSRPPPCEDEKGNPITREEWEERFPLSLYDQDK